MSKSVNIFGAAGSLVPDIIDSLSKENIEFNCFDNIGVTELIIPNKINIKKDTDLTRYKSWILGPATPIERKNAFIQASNLGITSWITILDKSAQISKTSEAFEGCYFNVNSSVGSKTQVGRHCFVNRHVSISHHVLIGDFVFLAPGAIISGRVTIENQVFIGSGAVLKNGICIGQNATIGAGAVVINDVMPNTTVAGNPARELI